MALDWSQCPAVESIPGGSVASFSSRRVKLSLLMIYAAKIKLLCRRAGAVPSGRPLPLAHPLPDFQARDRTAGRPKGLETPQGMRKAFPRPMGLLHEVVEIFRVAHDHGGLVSLVIVRDRGRGAAPLVDGNLLRQPLGANGFV
jgi:hypothetical protein